MMIYPNKLWLTDRSHYYLKDLQEEKLIRETCSIFIQDYWKELQE